MNNNRRNRRLKIHTQTLGVLAMSLILIGRISAAESSTTLKLIGSSAPEIQVQGNYSLCLPMLTGSGALTRGNNLTIDLSGKLSPISTQGSATATLTPLAILQLSAGGNIGTGWSIPLLDGMEGIQVGRYGTELKSDAFGGIYLKGKVGAAVQFDTGALFPSPWKSILLRSYHEINHTAYTGADEDELWDFELSGGRVNGFNYYASYFIGYRMPLALETVGVLLEVDELDLGGKTFPDPFYTIGLVSNIRIGKTFSMALIPQITTRKIDKDTRTSSSENFFFKRFAFQLEWKR
ncbi:hypothetical protein [Sediminispirochaeta smaragdinae]|uniref:Uncharacterized protein n=1 Tax=Sediminispirochaeta smaragdinae (strain DSM 11293 / JCM 15392 / SEBR 4228) TaxID=573413 RepID=E1R7V0_SEDSS|nr:hypothetical protein [Sediminispirochaeta smaragdinae]ADK82805.1 hypothetical protein Spirs_3719 [Sediminispirochaeta smaragdinae DSM 11293]